MRRQTGLRERKSGFTLIELMMVVSIIGVLASISYPSYRMFLCRSRATEAKITLKGIYTHEDTYNTEYDTYIPRPAADLAFLDHMMTTMSARRYTYDITADASTFQATATGEGNMAGDLWVTDQTMSYVWVSQAPECR
jgi:type IV pilus assembly protein PilE